MKKMLVFGLALCLITSSYGQTLHMVAGDTSGLSAHRTFDPPDHVACTITNHPFAYNLDVNQDGVDDLFLKCDYSYGGLGYGSYYLTVQALDSNEICFGAVDSSQCFNGYKPLYLARLFDFGETIADTMLYRQGEIIFSKDFWIMKDTCIYHYASTGLNYLAVRLNSHGVRGLAWVKLDLLAANGNGYSADVKETGYRSATTSLPESGISGVSVYPVPSTGFITVAIPGANGPMTAVICDLSGRQIQQTELQSGTNRISLQRGSYIIRVADRNHAVKISKCIVL